MSDSNDAPSDASESANDFPDVRVTSISKEDRPNGYEGEITLEVDHSDGQQTTIKAKVVMRDYPWDTEWQATLTYEGLIPAIPSITPVSLRFRALYGTVRGDERFDTLESETNLRDGQRHISRDEAKPRPNVPRPNGTPEEYIEAAKAFLGDWDIEDGLDDDEDAATRTEHMGNAQVGAFTKDDIPPDVLEDPLPYIPLMVGLSFLVGTAFHAMNK